MPREGILFILVGPSGAGKNTLMKPAKDHYTDLTQLATMTTRPKRHNEQQGREHWFVSEQEFQEYVDNGALIESQQVHGEDWYGTPRKTVEDAIANGQDLIADIEFLGASAIHEEYAEHVVLIFVTPSNLDILAERICNRGAITPEDLNNRLTRARSEMTFVPRCHFLVLNDSVDIAAAQLLQIIASERARRSNTSSEPGVILDRHVFHSTVAAVVQHGDSVLVRAGDPCFAFPRFEIDGLANPLDVILRERLGTMLGALVTVHSEPDDRFNFLPPNHVDITAPPPEVSIEYHYRCSVTLREPAPDGWEWRPLDSISVPAWFNRLISAG